MASQRIQAAQNLALYNQAVAAGDTADANRYYQAYAYHAGKPESGGLGGIFGDIAPILGGILGSIALPGIGTALGSSIGGLGTIGGALGAGLGGYATGASPSGILLDAVGGGLAPNAGDILNSFGGATGIGNSIGKVVGDPTLGSDIGGALSNFSDSTGLSQLFGGTAAPSSDLMSAYNAIDSTAPNLQATAGATAPIDFAPGGASASYTAGAAAPGSAGVGGGSLAGFGGDAGSIGESSALGSAQGAGPTGSFGYDLSGNASTPSLLGTGAGQGGPTSGFNFDISGNPAGASSYSPTQQFANAAAPSAGGNSVSGLASLFSGQSGSPLNGILKGGLGYLLNNDNSSGNKAITNASNAAQANFAPYMQAGAGAENTLSNLYGNNGADAQNAAYQNFQNTPGYQFSLNQGLNAINANNAQMGQTLSGNAQEAINNYAQGTASQQYNNYVNQLQNLASGGMSAAGGASTAGLTGAGARAQTGQNRANAQNSAIGSGLSGLFPTQLNLQQLLGTGGAGGSGGLLAALGLG